MTTHVMLDMETWGTHPGDEPRSIGACVFDPMAGADGGPKLERRLYQTLESSIVLDARSGTNPHLFYMPTNNPSGYWGRGSAAMRFFTDPWSSSRKYRMRRDPETVQWWSEQSEDAQSAFVEPVDLRDALDRFGHWLGLVGGYEYEPRNRKFLAPDTIRLWAHGAAADPTWVAAAYRAVDLPVPFHYRAPRDTRTAFDMVGIHDHSAWIEKYPGPLGIKHHALEDAICQARAVCAAYVQVFNSRDAND